MFLDFFYLLRSKGIPVSTGEYLDLLKVLRSWNDDLCLGELAQENSHLEILETRFEDSFLTLSRFYYIARATLVKDIKFYYDFSICFKEYFLSQLESDPEFFATLEKWLEENRPKELSAEQIANAPHLNPEELWKELEKRLQEQNERHDGGNKWVGTSGTSPFGNSGYNPNGVRIGGRANSSTAIDTIDTSEYKAYRSDEALDIRGIQIALKSLRILKKTGRREFHISKTIEATSKEGGELSLVFENSRKNDLRLVLLMDIGGSMTPYSEKVSKLFSAGNKMVHFKEFHYYYFHNIIYDHVFSDHRLREKIPVESLYRKFDSDTRFVYVGDACMNPYELFDKRHAFFEYFYRTQNSVNTNDVKSGFERICELRQKFPKSVWLNPETRRYWSHETIDAIWGIIPMYFLSVDGIKSAIKELL